MECSQENSCASASFWSSCRPHLFNRIPPGDCFWNKCTCKNSKPKCSHLWLLASLCNFNYWQIFVKNVNYLLLNKISERCNGQVFYKKDVVKNLAIFSEKRLYRSLFFLKKMQVFSPETLLKSGSNTGVFLWIQCYEIFKTPVLKNICERLFERLLDERITNK